MSEIHSVSNSLFQLRMYLLSAVFSESLNSDIIDLETSILNTTGIDLTKDGIVENLDADQITKLKEFETCNTKRLITIIQHSNDDSYKKVIAERDATINILTDQIDELKKAAGEKLGFVYWLGGSIAFTTIAYLFMATWIPIPPENRELSLIILGNLIGTTLSSIMFFFFGNKTDSKDKETQDE